MTWDGTYPPFPEIREEPAFIGDYPTAAWMWEGRYKDRHPWAVVCRIWDLGKPEPEGWHQIVKTFPSRERAEQSVKDSPPCLCPVSRDAGKTYEYLVWRCAAAELKRPD